MLYMIVEHFRDGERRYTGGFVTRAGLRPRGSATWQAG